MFSLALNLNTYKYILATISLQSNCDLLTDSHINKKKKQIDKKKQSQ